MTIRSLLLTFLFILLKNGQTYVVHTAIFFKHVWLFSKLRMKGLALSELTQQNGQNNSSATANELFECLIISWGWRLKG